MSTYWGYRCRTCPPMSQDASREDEIGSESPSWDNHGDDRLRALALCSPELKALLDKAEAHGCGGWLELRWLGCYQWPDPVAWLMKHYGHTIELLDEYGHAEPIYVATKTPAP